MAIVFNDTLRTGNDLIDSQHQELIARVNKLTEDCRVGTEKLVAVQTLGFLMDYTNVHFADEEKLQADNEYPLLDAHKVQHASFVKAVNELKDMLDEEEGPSEAFVEAVKKNIVEWLLNHICVWISRWPSSLKKNKRIKCGGSAVVKRRYPVNGISRIPPFCRAVLLWRIQATPLDNISFQIHPRIC